MQPVNLVAEAAVVELVVQRGGVAASCAGADELLAVDLLLQLGRAVVGIDETIDVSPEPQPEQQVVLSCAQRVPPGPGRRRRTSWRCRRPRAPAKLVQQRDDEPRAAHPERMADRDRAAVHVHLRLVDPELAHDRERLRGERLVQLDEVEVADREPGAVEQLAHRGHRPDPHHARVDTGDRRGDERAERLDPERARLLLRGDDDAPRRRRSAPTSCRP